MRETIIVDIGTNPTGWFLKRLPKSRRHQARMGDPDARAGPSDSGRSGTNKGVDECDQSGSSV